MLDKDRIEKKYKAGEREEVDILEKVANKGLTLRVGVGSLFSPRKAIVYYSK